MQPRDINRLLVIMLAAGCSLEDLNDFLYLKRNQSLDKRLMRDTNEHSEFAKLYRLGEILEELDINDHALPEKVEVSEKDFSYIKEFLARVVILLRYGFPDVLRAWLEEFPSDSWQQLVVQDLRRQPLLLTLVNVRSLMASKGDLKLEEPPQVSLAVPSDKFREDPWVALPQVLPPELQTMYVSDLIPSIRISNIFRRNEILRVRDLLRLSRTELLALPNVTKRVVERLADEILHLVQKGAPNSTFSVLTSTTSSAQERDNILKIHDPTATNNKSP